MTTPVTPTTARPLVGYGVPYPEDSAHLAVACPTCKAPAGRPCATTRKPKHVTRSDRLNRLASREAFRLFERLERAALERDPDGPLWQYTGVPHHCGVLGAHPLTECDTRPAT